MTEFIFFHQLDSIEHVRFVAVPCPNGFCVAQRELPEPIICLPEGRPRGAWVREYGSETLPVATIPDVEIHCAAFSTLRVVHWPCPLVAMNMAGNHNIYIVSIGVW